MKLNKKVKISEGLNYHLENNLPLNDNIFRYSSLGYCKLINEVRKLYLKKLISINEEEIPLVENFILIEKINNVEYICNLPLVDKIEDNKVHFKVNLFENNKIKTVKFKKDSKDIFTNENAYTNTFFSEKIIERVFSEDVDISDLKWHFDEDDREIIVKKKTNWKIQFENELPKILESGMKIKKGEYHRLIKGSGSLEVKILM